MADWKKVIVSGSSAELAGLTLDTALTVANGGTGLTATGNNNFLVGDGAASLTTVGSNGTGTVVRTTGATGLVASGSFSGSFQGDGSNLTGVVAGTPNALEDGDGIANFSYDGNTSGVLVAVQADSTTGGNTKSVAVSANGVGFDISTIDGNGLGTSGGELVVNVDDSSIEINSDSLRVKAGGVTNAMLAKDSIQIGTTDIALGATGSTVAGLTLTGVTASGSFSGSFQGDGSGLTGLASTLTIDADTGGTGTVDLLTQTFDIAGGTNINTSLSSQTITVNLDSNISVTDAIVTGDLTVNGTASFANTENLLVADRFVLFASGSTIAGDGGIVVQQDTQNVGELFAYDSSRTRWGVTGSFSADAGAYTPDAFMATVVEGAASDPTAVVSKYTEKGNIFIAANQDIYIYS
jgi:hypothetical protein